MKNFSKVILDWYDENRRTLPWRESKDAYRIWISEVILQQTRVAQGLPYYLSFVDAFPSVNDLARAPEDTVLRLWQGLGYYSRARNLHKCAKVVSEKYNGVFPSTYDELLALPGVGPYTAAAIASIAFNRKVAVVDGNVYRVLSRIFGIDTDITSTEGKKEFQEMANRLISEKNPGDHNQAVMEFGATLCTPSSPRCNECPFRKQCVAYAKDLIDKLPVKEKKTKKRTRYFYYFILRNGNKIAMKKRTGRDIWNGLYEFYLIETGIDKKLKTIIESDAVLKNVDQKNVIESGTIRHLLSHQELIIRFFEVDLSRGAMRRDIVLNEFSFVDFEQAEGFPKPIVISKQLAAVASKPRRH